MKFKEIQRNGVFCWSPTSRESSIAIGTTSQQFDTNFSNDSKLEIYGLNVDKCSEETSLWSSGVVTNTFNCIVWHSNALIGGSQLKTLQFYNISNEEIKLKDETEGQTSNFLCLDLNSKESHSLCAGCDDGSVGVWDIEKRERTLNLISTAANDSVNAVKWNRQVSTILAAASNSTVQVWDTRKAINAGPIMRVHDNNATSVWGSGPQSLMICRSLVWSESNATSLILANSNDANPILQLWDLRYATCPLNHFKGGHSRGIQSISWNKYDEQMLLSAGKDNAVCLWDPTCNVNEEPLQAVIPYITNQWINDIEWCDWQPMLFAVNSFDGNTTIYNITQTNSLNQTNTKILESFALNSQNNSTQQMQPSVQRQPILTRAPKWLRTPCRASFGFGGKLVTYNVVITQSQSQPQPPTQYTQHIMTVHQVMTDTELISRAEKLENALSNGNFLDYCFYKITEHSDNDNISMAWKLVALHLERDPQKQRDTLLELLGNDSKVNNSIENLCDLANSQLATRDLTNSLSQNSSELSQSFDTNENIRNNLVEPNPSKLGNSLSIDTTDSRLGTQINRAILSGDLEPVVKKCIASNNWAEAILVCCFVSPEHTASTLRQYFDYCQASQPDSWSSLLWCIISAQTASDEEAVHVFEELISKVELKFWRQVLVFIIRESENWENINTKGFLIDSLAKRLIDSYVDSGSKLWLNAGMYCYIINGDYVNVSKFLPFGSHLDQIELSLILQKSTNTQFVVNQLTAHYAKLLAIEGKLELALKYIDDNEIELKDRIVGALRFNVNSCVYASQTTQVVAPRVIKTIQNIQTFNRAPTYPTPVPTPVPTAVPMPVPKYTPPMSPTYGMPTNMNSYQSGVPNFSTAPGIAPPIATNINAVPPMYSLTHQNTTPSAVDPYGTQNYSEQFGHQSVTPGWNDPPVITNPRHNSFSAPHSETHPPVFNPITANPMMTPLPVVEPERVEQNGRQMSQSRRQSVPNTSPPSEPLSPQNQQIFDAFDRLLSHLQQSPNSQALNIRRKLEDSRLKLETLKSKLGSNSQLSPNTLLGLSEIANAINRNEFQTALQFHTNLVASTTFGETAAFLPAIKVILHLAQQRIHS